MECIFCALQLGAFPTFPAFSINCREELSWEVLRKRLLFTVYTSGNQFDHRICITDKEYDVWEKCNQFSQKTARHRQCEHSF